MDPQTPIQVTHTGYPYRLPIHPYRLPIQVPKHVWVRYPDTHTGHPYTLDGHPNIVPIHLYGCMGGVPIRFWVPVWVGCMGVWVACMGRLYG